MLNNVPIIHMKGALSITMYLELRNSISEKVGQDCVMAKFRSYVVFVQDF